MQADTWKGSQSPKTTTSDTHHNRADFRPVAPHTMWPEAVLSFTCSFSQDHPTPSGVSSGELPPLAAWSTRIIPKEEP